MFKKITAWIIISGLSIASGFAMTLSSEVEHANNLAEKWIINNHKNDPQNYNLWDNVLRQEIAAVARATYEARLWKEIGGLKKKTCDNTFADVSSTNPNSWACYSVEALVDNDLISKNTNFRPEDKITKSEAVAMLIKAIWFDYEYNPGSSYNWQQQVVMYAANMWVVENFTDYNTDATRGWVFQMADFVIKKDEEIKAAKKKQEWTYSDEAM